MRLRTGPRGPTAQGACVLQPARARCVCVHARVRAHVCACVCAQARTQGMRAGGVGVRDGRCEFAVCV